MPLRTLVLSAALVLLGSVNASAASDPEAVAVAGRLMEAMGGREVFDAQRTIVFRFTVVREGEQLSDWVHVWDRPTGRYRLEGETSDGEFVRVLFNVNTKEGEVWLNENTLSGEDAAAWLERAYGRFINDTYWLLMPWKWLDPGVNLAYEGEKTVEGRTYDVVRLTFGDVGLTSNDVYWGYVSRETGLMDRWEYLLQDKEGNPGTGEPTAWRWEDWEDTGSGVLLATVKRLQGSDADIAITHPLARTSPDAAEEALHPPPPPAARPPESATGTPPRERGLGELLVVLNKSEHTAALVDPASGEVVRRIPTGLGPHEAAVSRDGKTLYVANYGTRKPGSTISVIDLPTGAVRRVVDLGEHRRPHGIQVAPDGAVWVTTEESRRVLCLAPEDLSVRTEFVTDQDVTHMVVLSPDGERAFASSIGSGTVSVLDVETGEVTTLESGGGAEGIDIAPDGSEVWVANRADDTITVFDAESLDVLDTLPTGDFPIRVKFTPGGERVLVSCAESNELIAYDARSREERKRLAIDAAPIGILVTPDGATAYVAITGADKVTVIDLDDMTVSGEIRTGREPDGMAWASWDGE